MNRDGLPELLDGLPGPAWADVTDDWVVTDDHHAWRTHQHTITESEWVHVEATESYDGRRPVMGLAMIDVLDAACSLTAGQARALAQELIEAAALADWINDDEGDAA